LASRFSWERKWRTVFGWEREDDAVGGGESIQDLDTGEEGGMISRVNDDPTWVLL
jgi:hypothetical protein